MTQPPPSETAAPASRRSAQRILLLGATGTIGRATARELMARGHEVIAFARPQPDGAPQDHPRAEIRYGTVTDPDSLRRDGFRGERFDAVISCLASRTGAPKDAWAVDYEAHRAVLAAAQESGVTHFVLLSAICVQKPRLAFQYAKLAFEKEVRESGLTYSIVRPTAYFKSLSGQIERVKRGKPFLIFGDGTLTACTPISDRDLAIYLADCLDAEERWNRILPIGGPGRALTPRMMGEKLFALTGYEPNFKSVPAGMLQAVAGGLGLVGRFVPAAADKAELARIGHYYATESMLLWDPEAGRYDSAATPRSGTDTLFDHYAKVLRGEAEADLGAHAVFDRG